MLNGETHSEKCIIRQFHPCVNMWSSLPTSGWYGLPHTWAIWYSPLFLGCKPVRHVTIQSNRQITTRENDAIKRCRKQDVYGAVASTTQHSVLQQTFLISRNNTL